MKKGCDENYSILCSQQFLTGGRAYCTMQIQTIHHIFSQLILPNIIHPPIKMCIDNLWIQENAELRGRITEAYCGMNSITLDCDNFDPQPTYPAEDPNDTGYTTFQQNCLDERGAAGLFKEYTCNFDDPIAFVRPDSAPVHPSTENCGAGSVFRRRR